MILVGAELLRQRHAHLCCQFATGRGVSRHTRSLSVLHGEVAALASGVEGTSLVVRVENLLLADVIRNGRAGHTLRDDLAAPVLLRDDVVLGVLVAEPLHHLRVSGE